MTREPIADPTEAAARLLYEAQLAVFHDERASDADRAAAMRTLSHATRHLYTEVLGR